MILTNGRLFDGRKFLKKNTIEIADGVIRRIYSAKGRVCGAINLRGNILCPGLVDLHTHAAAKTDFLGVKSKKEMARLKRAYLRQGVTSFLATTLYDPADTGRARAIKWAAEVKTGADCLGVYLEGPFINPAKKGAIPGKYISAEGGVRMAEEILRKYPALKIMTVAPELPGAGKIIRYLRNKGVIASFGHSDAGTKKTKMGIKQGIRHVTHLFNGMRKWGDKDPSYKALLADKRIKVEVIADGRHVPPDILKMIYKKFGRNRIILISDATGGKGHYDAAREVGTNLPLLELVRRMKTYCGISTADALRMATYNPGSILGEGRGTLAEGVNADLAVLSRSLRHKQTFKSGRVQFNCI
jgi:N-acetylglucosamine-6-phosphate deacetylase